MSSIMRLINVDDFRLQSFRDSGNDKVPKYAIFSHRWNQAPQGVNDDAFRPWNEILYENYPKEDSPEDDARRNRWLDPVTNQIPQDTGEGKIAWACHQLRQDTSGPRWLWIDTACIDKSNNAELDEAINSMMRWYRNATVCIVYLKDVSPDKNEHNKKEKPGPGNDSEAMRGAFERPGDQAWPWLLGSFDSSEWFYRGWTLQELLAPSQLRFFDYKWRSIGTRAERRREIESATGIESKYLDGSSYLQPCIAVKMSWMAQRITSKLEDIAYCLLGILNKRMPVNYGEREAAFLRLQEKLVQDTRDESIFAWTDVSNQLETESNSKTFGLLAPWPSFFANARNLTINNSKEYRRRPDYNTSKGGVLFPLPMKYPEDGNGVHLNNRTFRKLKTFKLSLNCWVDGQPPDKHVTIELVRENEVEPFRRQLKPRLLLESCSQASFDRLAGTNKTREASIPNIGPDQAEQMWAEDVVTRCLKKKVTDADGIELSNHRERMGFRRLLFGD